MASSGRKLLSYPVMIPHAAAHCTASQYHAFSVTSVKAVCSVLSGCPAMLYSTEAAIARVIVTSGEKVYMPVPDICPRSTASPTAS